MGRAESRTRPLLAVRLAILVRPGAATTRVGGEHDGALVVRVMAPAEHGIVRRYRPDVRDAHDARDAASASDAVGAGRPGRPTQYWVAHELVALVAGWPGT